MEKMKMHTLNLADENITRIREMFPGCVTEVKDENGTKKLSIDFDQLRQELSDHIVEGPQERYRLNWPGKQEALLIANAPIEKTLRTARDESMEFDGTKNLFIEGDNLAHIIHDCRRISFEHTASTGSTVCFLMLIFRGVRG